jgi:hypothetical protein
MGSLVQPPGLVPDGSPEKVYRLESEFPKKRARDAPVIGTYPCDGQMTGPSENTPPRVYNPQRS